MEVTQLKAVFGALSFLGTLAALVAAVAVILLSLLIGERRLATAAPAVSQWLFGGRGLVRKVLMAALVLVSGYFTVLLAFSLLSRETILSPGEEKYFCEIDCHLARGLPWTSRCGRGRRTKRSLSLMCRVKPKICASW